VKFGSFDIRVVSDGEYRLDGGSMFGVVPKPVWEPLHPADEHNRIRIALNCLLMKGNGRVVLVDTGMGHGWDEKQIERYGLQRPEGDLLDALRRDGVDSGDVTDVILTHLHFDHAGGAVRFDGERTEPTFANARYWLQKTNLKWAENPTLRDRRSYRRERWESLLELGDRLELVDGDRQIFPDVFVRAVNGHTPGQQLVIVHDDEGPALCYCGDLIPLASHVHLPYIMAFDLNPLITLNEKRDLLIQAATEDWTLVFEHDSERVAAKVSADEGRFSLGEVVEL